MGEQVGMHHHAERLVHGSMRVLSRTRKRRERVAEHAMYGQGYRTGHAAIARDRHAAIRRTRAEGFAPTTTSQ